MNYKELRVELILILFYHFNNAIVDRIKASIISMLI